MTKYHNPKTKKTVIAKNLKEALQKMKPTPKVAPKPLKKKLTEPTDDSK